jgi:hypothetical protein
MREVAHFWASDNLRRYHWSDAEVTFERFLGIAAVLRERADTAGIVQRGESWVGPEASPEDVELEPLPERVNGWLAEYQAAE